VLAYLRIDGNLTILAARLTTGPPGSALTGRDSHPLDDKQDFRTSAMCILPDQLCLVALHHSLRENGRAESFALSTARIVGFPLVTL
jgi:hypothetical protein